MIFYLIVNISNNMVRTRRFVHKIFNLGTFSRSFSSTVDEKKSLPFPESISKRWEAQSAFFMTIVGYWGRMIIRKFFVLLFVFCHQFLELIFLFCQSPSSSIIAYETHELMIMNSTKSAIKSLIFNLSNIFYKKASKIIRMHPPA